MHPMEVVFIKASWHVGEPFTSKYSEWLLAQAEGRPTTQGSFDEALYRYAVTYVFFLCFLLLCVLARGGVLGCWGVYWGYMCAVANVTRS